MIRLSSYRSNPGAFKISFVLVIIGTFCLTFSHYFSELPASEKHQHQAYFYQSNLSLDNSTPQRARIQVVTFQTLLSGIDGLIAKSTLNLLVSVKSKVKNFGALHYLSLSREALYLLCRLRL